MISRILRVDSSPESNGAAINLSRLIQTEQKKPYPIPIHDFHYQQKNPFNTDTIQDLGSAQEEFNGLLFLGHTGGEDHLASSLAPEELAEHTRSEDGRFGGFSPEEFADHFNHAFEGPRPSWFRAARPYKYEDKQQVRDLYLIGCTVGLANPGKNDSYAQHLANRLYERGFSQVRVHALAYEKRVLGESVRVKVISKPAASDCQTLPGFIAAYGHTREHERLLSVQRAILEASTCTANEKAQAQKTIENLERKAEKEYPILAPVSPIGFLAGAENTYLPHKTLRQRVQCVTTDSHYIERQERERIVRLLQPIREKHQKHDKKTRVFIDLFEGLRENYHTSWRALCETARAQYDATLIRIPGSKTLLMADDDLPLLTKLSKGIIPAIAEIKEVEEKRDTSTNKHARGCFRFAPHAFFSIPLPQATRAIPEGLREEIEELQTALDDEISQLRDRAAHSFFSFFLEFEIETKSRKSACLAKLLKATCFAALQQQAQEALDDGRIVRHVHNSCSGEWGRSRTQELLKKIQQMPAPEGATEVKETLGPTRLPG